MKSLQSRKLWFAIFVVFMIAVGGAGCAFAPELMPLYTTYVGGIVGALGIYSGANVGTKFAPPLKAGETEAE